MHLSNLACKLMNLFCLFNLYLSRNIPIEIKNVFNKGALATTNKHET